MSGAGEGVTSVSMCRLSQLRLAALLGFVGWLLLGATPGGFSQAEEPECEDCEQVTGIQVFPPLIRVTSSAVGNVNASTLSGEKVDWDLPIKIRTLKVGHETVVIRAFFQEGSEEKNSSSVDIGVLLAPSLRNFRQPVNFTVHGTFNEAVDSKAFQVLPVGPEVKFVSPAQRYLVFGEESSVDLRLDRVGDPEQCQWSRAAGSSGIRATLKPPAKGRQVTVMVELTNCGPGTWAWFKVEISCEDVFDTREVFFPLPHCPDDDD